mmetsp:Transcript_4219/g.10213  ORF Transcript_4219/g.10213 Transcript_4219/m.10213 type:complete len:266 (-) Transcript_4219:435-1232(-)
MLGDPPMVEEVACCRPAPGDLGDAPPDEVSSVVVHVGRELRLHVHDPLLRLLLLAVPARVKRGAARQQLVSDDTHGPNVGARPVLKQGVVLVLLRPRLCRADDHLRSHVLQRPNRTDRPLVRVVDREPEIYQFDRVVIVHEDYVLGLQIAVHYALGVQVGERVEHLGHEPGDDGLRVEGLPLVHVVEEVALPGRLEQKIHVIRVFKRAVHLDDVLVGDCAVDLNLPLHLLPVDGSKSIFYVHFQNQWYCGAMHYCPIYDRTLAYK